MGDGAVVDFLAGSSIDHPERYAAPDPMSGIADRLPVRIVHGRQDDVVPMDQSDTHVAATRAAGQDVALAPIDGDHMQVVDPAHPACDALLAAVDQISATA